MDPITFRNQPIPGIEVASMRPSNDQAIIPPGEHTTPSEQVAQRASPPCLKTRPPKTLDDPEKGTLNKPSSSSRAMVVPALSVAVLRMILTSPEARQTSRGSPVQGRSCLGDRGTVRRAARREPKASLDRGLAQWDSRISVRKQRLRSPARSGDSMDLSWRGASISQFQKACAGTLPRRTDLEDPPPHQSRGVHRLWNSVVIEWPHHRSSGLIEWPLEQVTSPAASEVHSTQQATSCAEFKARFEQQPTTFAASSARFEQQWTSNRINDERISQRLRLRQLTEAEIYTLMSPSSPSSSVAPGGSASSSSSSLPAPHDSR